MTRDGISVIICSYNSSNLISKTIKHLVKQKINKNLEWEIIIVNNGSNDNIEMIARAEWENCQCSDKNLIIVDEPLIGLSNARKKGIETAHFEIVIFCDDDNWLQEDFLMKAYCIMISNPVIGALGGQSTAESSVDFPDWFNDYKYAYAVGQQAEYPSIVTHRKFLWGAGLVSRKSVLMKVLNDDFPPILTDRQGRQLSSGGDSEICARLILLGYDLYYDPSLSFIHFIPTERLTLDYKENLFLGFDLAYEILKKYHLIIDFTTLNFFGKLWIILIKVIKTILFIKEKDRIHNLRNYIAITTNIPNLAKDQHINKILQFKRSNLTW